MSSKINYYIRKKSKAVMLMYICHICESLIFFFIPLGSASLCLFQLLELILSVWQTQHGNAFHPTSICINVGFTTWMSLTARWIFCPWAVSGRSRNEQHSWYKEVCLTKQQLLLRNEIPRPMLQAHGGLRFVFHGNAQTWNWGHQVQKLPPPSPKLRPRRKEFQRFI